MMMFWVIQLVWQYWELQIFHEKDAYQVAKSLTYPALWFFRLCGCWIPEMWNWNFKFPRLSSQYCLQVKICSGVHGRSASISVWSWSYPSFLEFLQPWAGPKCLRLGPNWTSMDRSVLVCRSLVVLSLMRKWNNQPKSINWYNRLSHLKKLK